jgi:TolB-like 6-blade propeller-like
MNQVRPIILSFILIVILSGCGNKGANIKNSKFGSIPVASAQIGENRPALAPLPEGEIHMTDAAFGETINLTGKPVNIKENIKPEQLFVKENYLITNNQRKDSVFMIFEIPSMKCVAAFGERGNGPNEFGFPRIVETVEDSILFYIYDNNEKVYKVSIKNLYPKYYITLSKKSRSLDEKQIVFINNKTAYFSATASKSKMIYYFNKDSIPQDKSIIDLAIHGIKGSWTTLIGDFGINTNCGRIAYAYKYFKRLRIIDINSLKARNIIFEAKNIEKGLNDIATLEPTNITHFWGMSANNEYFWMLYSGRTPVDVYNDNRNKKKYIFVEKFDWNGNPVRRYKLDDWGFFCVDKKNETLYLASTASIYSLIRYDLAASSNK